jgi:hypothetical protein
VSIRSCGCEGLEVATESDPATLLAAQFEAQQLRKQVNALQKDLGKCMRVRQGAHGAPQRRRGEHD